MNPAALKHLAFRAVSRARRLLSAPDTNGLRVLMYHSVGGAFEDLYGTSLPQDSFAAQLDRLLELGLTAVPLDTALRGAAITFDDGYRDTLTAAAPLLAARKIPFTAFVVASGKGDTGGEYLSPSELKELAAVPGASIGAHGFTHRALDELADRELAEELRRSRAALEDILGRPVTALSYPYGRVDRRVRDAAAAAGFTLGACSRYGLNRPGRDPLLLCRTEITAWDSLEDFSLKAQGHWDWFALRQGDPAK